MGAGSDRIALPKEAFSPLPLTNRCTMLKRPCRGCSSTAVPLAITAAVPWTFGCSFIAVPGVITEAGPPWIRIMQQAVLFSHCVCVAGSVGTWLAEYSTAPLSRPPWDPHDIDVFLMVQTGAEFDAGCESFLMSLGETLYKTGLPYRMKSHRKYAHMLNIQWWVTWDGIEVMCPEFSLIQSPKLLRPVQLMSDFDIDICRVSVHACAGTMFIQMSLDVRRSIAKRELNCVMRKHPSSPNFIYPMQRTLDRVSKYVARGYRFVSLSFVASAETPLNVSDFQRVWTAQTQDQAPANPYRELDQASSLKRVHVESAPLLDVVFPSPL